MPRLSRYSHAPQPVRPPNPCTSKSVLLTTQEPRSTHRQRGQVIHRTVNARRRRNFRRDSHSYDMNLECKVVVDLELLFVCAFRCQGEVVNGVPGREIKLRTDNVRDHGTIGVHSRCVLECKGEGDVR